MDLEGKLRKAFELCSANLVIFLPRAVELGLQVVTFLVFAVAFLLALGFGLASMGASSVDEIEAFPSLLGTQAFILFAFLIFGGIVLLFLTLLLRGMARAAVIGMAEEGLASGSTGLETGWAAAKKHGFDVFLASLLIGIVILLLLSVGFTPLIFGALAGLDETLLLALGLFGFFIAMIAWVLFQVLTLFAPQEIVLKQKGVLGGIKGSIGFVRQNAIDVIIYIAVVIGISIAVGMLSLGVFMPFSILASNSPFFNVATSISQNLLSVVIGLLLAPYYETVKTAMVAETREGSSSASDA